MEWGAFVLTSKVGSEGLDTGACACKSSPLLRYHLNSQGLGTHLPSAVLVKMMSVPYGQV